MAKAKVVAETREILYPDLEVFKCVMEDAITETKAKDLLGWETEKAYTARMLKEKPELKAEEAVFGNVYLLEDEEGNKVRCWNNLKNRPFGDTHSKALAQDILKRNWAGGICMPGETVNGETIVISRTGRTVSGQHRLIGLVLACQIWRGKNKAHWLKLWPKAPVLESVLVVGVSEDPRILRTLDNVKPRSLSDVFYTSELFDLLSPAARLTASNNLSKAVDLLWKRAGAGENTFTRFQTHSESIEFVQLHKRILDCLKHIVEENADRPLSAIGIGGGVAAGLMYLMAASASEYDVYQAAVPRTEANINFENYPHAEAFWRELCLGSEKGGPLQKAVSQAIAELANVETGNPAKLIEKLAVITNAWNQHINGNPIVVDGEDGIKPKYVVKDNGTKKMVDYPDFGGIDIGMYRSSQDDDEVKLTEEELAEAKEQARLKRAEAVSENLKKAHAAKLAKDKEAGEEKPDGTPVAPAPKPKVAAPAKTPAPAPKAQTGTPPRPKPRPGNASK